MCLGGGGGGGLHGAHAQQGIMDMLKRTLVEINLRVLIIETYP